MKHYVPPSDGCLDTPRRSASGQETVETAQEDVLVGIHGLTKRFEGRTPVTALQDVDLDIHRGEFLSIVGPSGCGKTTLLRIIAGLEESTAGEIRFREDVASSIGFVFQEPNLLHWRTALANASLILELRGTEKALRTEKAREVLRLTGLEGYEDFLPADLSGGMKQRVAIARSLAHDPAVLVMDEPFAALDVLTREEMCHELWRIWRTTGKTVLYVTHDIREAVLLSSRVAVMTAQPGRIKRVVHIGLPEERDANLLETEEFLALHRTVRQEIESTKGRVEPAPRVDPLRPGQRLPRSWFGWPATKIVATAAEYAAVTLGAIGLWKFIVWAFHVPKYMLPAPEVVFRTYAGLATTTLWAHTWMTVEETLLGFVVGAFLGFFAGYLIGRFPRIGAFMMPLAVAAQTAPKIALAPLLVVWLGFGILSKVVLIALMVFFPILINSILGLNGVERDKRELLQTGNATLWQAFCKLELPTMLPALFAGMKTGITLAVIGAVVGEFVGARGGLGYLTTYSAGLMDTPMVFAAILQLVVLGIVLYALVAAGEKAFIPWQAKQDVGMSRKGRERGAERRRL